MPRTSFVLVLHAHLPWVRHPELPFFLEEHWLFEATAETYLPLIEVARGWLEDGVSARLAIDVSPTLAAMLSDPVLQERTVGYFENLLSLEDRILGLFTQKEVEASRTLFTK